MADVFSKKERSRIMSRIRSKNTKPEVKLANFLRKKGMRGFKMHYAIAGKPDIAFPKLKIAIFIDGCFWHRCPEHGVLPKSNKSYWLPKIKRNVQRDKQQNSDLKKKGWSVIRIWEHETKGNEQDLMKKVCRKINQRRRKRQGSKLSQLA